MQPAEAIAVGETLNKEETFPSAEIEGNVKESQGDGLEKKGDTNSHALANDFGPWMIIRRLARKKKENRDPLVWVQRRHPLSWRFRIKGPDSSFLMPRMRRCNMEVPPYGCEPNSSNRDTGT